MLGEEEGKRGAAELGWRKVTHETTEEEPMRSMAKELVFLKPSGCSSNDNQKGGTWSIRFWTMHELYNAGLDSEKLARTCSRTSKGKGRSPGLILILRAGLSAF